LIQKDLRRFRCGIFGTDSKQSGTDSNQNAIANVPHTCRQALGICRDQREANFPSRAGQFQSSHLPASNPPAGRGPRHYAAMGSSIRQYTNLSITGVVNTLRYASFRSVEIGRKGGKTGNGGLMACHHASRTLDTDVSRSEGLASSGMRRCVAPTRASLQPDCLWRCSLSRKVIECSL